VKATEVTAGLAESNGSLLPDLWRDTLHVTCGLTACTPGSAPGPTLGKEYGKTFLFLNIVWSGSTPASRRGGRIRILERRSKLRNLLKLKYGPSLRTCRRVGREETTVHVSKRAVAWIRGCHPTLIREFQKYLHAFNDFLRTATIAPGTFIYRLLKWCWSL